MEEEEPRAWEGWWNEQIVQLVELSMAQDDALVVLLTGRKESAFAEIIQRMVRAKKLGFDMVCLKPEVGPSNQRLTSTMMFKQELLKDLVFTYSDADEMKVYEDRPRHTQGFRDFFDTLNNSLSTSSSPGSRKPLLADVIQVPERATSLDPVTEVAEVQRMINAHNKAILSGAAPLSAKPLAINRSVFFTGYLISPQDSARLCALVNSSTTTDPDVRLLGNSILMTPRPCPPSLLRKVGGIGHRVIWRVTGLSVLENRVWAARVAPVDTTSKTQIHTENAVPTLVLALRRNARPIDASRITNWRPAAEHEALVFESTVGEKVQLRVEEERAPSLNSHAQAEGFEEENGGLVGEGMFGGSSRKRERLSLIHI